MLYWSTILCVVTIFTHCTVVKDQNMNKKENILVFNQETSIVGIYQKCILSKRQEATHQGYYKIIVNDQLEIVLLPPYEKEAKRPADEVQQFEGKKVRVTGVVEEETYMEEPSLDYDVLTVDIPCFASIKSIELIE